MRKKRLRIKDPKLKQLVETNARKGSKKDFIELLKRASRPGI